jgi:hypothetical protein
MDQKIMKRVQEHYNKVVELNYEVVGVFLYGSQNYKLNNENSDVDTKAIVLPKFEDIVLNHRPVSCEHVMDDGSHIDIKDIRLMFNEFTKANINFVELLFTEYNLINPKYSDLLFPICEHNEEIARYKPVAALKCTTGTATGKLKEISKNFSYKTASTILRLEDFCISYIDGKDYLDCIVPTDLEFIKSVKDGSCTMSQAEIMNKCEYAVAHCKLLLEAYERFHETKINKQVDVLLNNIIADILSNLLKEDIDNYKTKSN